VGPGVATTGIWGGVGVGIIGVGLGVDSDAFGGSGAVRVIGSMPFLCLLVSGAIGESRGSICRFSLLVVRVLTLKVTCSSRVLIFLYEFCWISSGS
jgi:hypothetical protein